MKAEGPSSPRRAPVAVPSSTPAPVAASPALVVDDEHQRPTLEQRLDAAILAAGATPPAGMKAPKAKILVPLRLDAPTALSTHTDVRAAVDSIAPQPRMLQFLLDDVSRGGADDSVSRIPRLAPIADSKANVAVVGVTNVYRLDVVVDGSDELPNRALPLADDEVITAVGKPFVKVLTVESATSDHGINVSAFSFDEEDDEDLFTAEGDAVVRAAHAPAAMGLFALSDEGAGDFGDAVDYRDVSDAHLDELARQLGLEALPPSMISVKADDAGVDLAALRSALDEPAENSDTSGEAFSAMADELMAEFGDRAAAIGDGIVTGDDDDLDDDLELADVADVADFIPHDALKATDPMRVLRRVPSTVIVAPDIEEADADRLTDLAAAAVAAVAAEKAAASVHDAFEDHVDDDFDDDAEDEKSNTAPLPMSLFSSVDEAPVHTPAYGVARSSLEAPNGVRFIGETAQTAGATTSTKPASTPPKPVLTAEEIARNQQRAHDLYLVALDDIACKDADSAIVHLQLALAYDEDTSLYGDLLAQLEKQQQRKRAS